MSTRAASEGLDLCGGNRVVLLDVSWNPATDQQASGRCYRYGQLKPVHVYRLVAAGTFEEAVYRRQICKQGLAKALLDKAEATQSTGAGSTQLFDSDEFENTMNSTSVSELPGWNRQALEECEVGGGGGGGGGSSAMHGPGSASTHLPSHRHWRSGS